MKTFQIVISILMTFFLFSTTAMAQRPNVNSGNIAGVWQSFDEAANKTVFDFSPYNYFKVTTDVGGESWGKYKIEGQTITLDFWTMVFTMTSTLDELFSQCEYIGPSQHIVVPEGVNINNYLGGMNEQTQRMHMNSMEMIDDMSGSDDYDYYIEDSNGNTYGKDW